MGLVNSSAIRCLYEVLIVVRLRCLPDVDDCIAVTTYVMNKQINDDRQRPMLAGYLGSNLSQWYSTAVACWGRLDGATYQRKSQHS